jgi:hypothetical protein
MNWIKIILIVIIVCVVIQIVLESNKSTNVTNATNVQKEYYINITNPFVDGLSQAQLGADMPDESQILGPDTLPISNANNVITSPDKLRELNYYDQILYKKDNAKLLNDINQIKSLKKGKKKGMRSKPKPIIPCKKLNKFFVESQFNDAYRDVLTAFNYICPDQKSIFNLQTLPVTTTVYNPKSTNPYPPFEFIKLVTQFINKLNAQIKELPENAEIINNNNSCFI